MCVKTYSTFCWLNTVVELNPSVNTDTLRCQTSKPFLGKNIRLFNQRILLLACFFGGSGRNCCWKCVWVLLFHKKERESDLWELRVPLLSLQLQFPLRHHTLKTHPLCLCPWTLSTWTCWTRTKRLEQPTQCPNLLHTDYIKVCLRPLAEQTAKMWKHEQSTSTFPRKKSSFP